MTPFTPTEILLFTDAATSSTTGISLGVVLCLDEKSLNVYKQYSDAMLYANLKNNVIYIQYESKKSTWSEIKTVIEGLHKIHENYGTHCRIKIYTDCQSLCDLINVRKEKLQSSQYITRSGKVLQNADLYKELFLITEKFQLQTFKIKGHTTVSQRISVEEKIFAILDRLCRQQLRLILQEK